MYQPILELEKAIYAALTAETSLTDLVGTNIFGSNSTEYADPYVLFRWQAGGEDNWTKTRSRSPSYFVQAVTTDRKLALQLSDAIDTALGSVTLNLTGWKHIRTFRKNDIQFSVPLGSNQYSYTVGALYQFLIEKE